MSVYHFNIKNNSVMIQYKYLTFLYKVNTKVIPTLPQTHTRASPCTSEIQATDPQWSAHIQKTESGIHCLLWPHLDLWQNLSWQTNSDAISLINNSLGLFFSLLGVAISQNHSIICISEIAASFQRVGTQVSISFLVSWFWALMQYPAFPEDCYRPTVSFLGT